MDLTGKENGRSIGAASVTIMRADSVPAGDLVVEVESEEQGFIIHIAASDVCLCDLRSLEYF